IWAEQGLVHFHAAANLDRANWIGGDRLIHVTEPREAWWSPAGADLSHAVRPERARSLENYLVDFGHFVYGIVLRRVMMLGVVAGRDRLDVVELVSIEVPVHDETFREFAVIFANFWQSRAQRRQVTCHARWLPILIKGEPVGMLFRHIRQRVLVVFVA